MKIKKCAIAVTHVQRKEFAASASNITGKVVNCQRVISIRNMRLPMTAQ